MKQTRKQTRSDSIHLQQLLQRKRKRWLLVLGLCMLAAGIMGGLIWFQQLPAEAEVRQIFASPETLRAFLLRAGWWAPVIFVLLQAIQVIFSPIPGSITTLAGGLLFGVWQGTILSSIGMTAGSLVAFLLARWWGQRAVILLIGQANFARYSRFWTGRGGLSLLLLFLLPFFPDDVLCLLAGLSTLPFRMFLLFVLIGRIPTIVLTSLIGAGVVSFSLWQWIVIGILAAGILLVFFKYGAQVEQWVQRKADSKAGAGKQGRQ